MSSLTRKTLAAAALMALALTGCKAGGDKTETASGVSVVKKGQLTVCTHLPYEPFQYQKNGKIVGFDVDLMNLVAKKLSLKQNIINTPFETIETGQAMNTGKCDIAAAGMTITDDRKKVIDFSDPYFDATQALLVKKGANIQNIDSLKGKTLGVQVGTTGEKYANDKAVPAGADLKVFEDLALELEAVKTGSVDAAINDNTVLYDYASKNPDTTVPTEFDTGEQYGFGVAKGQNTELIKTVNQAFAQAHKDGTYDKLFKKYFPNLKMPTDLG